MNVLEVEVVGLKQFQEKLAKSGANATVLTRAAVVNASEVVKSRIRAKAPHRTGTLQRGVQYEMVGSLASVVSEQEKYGIFVEEGTGLYGPKNELIRPQTAKVLHFTSGGKEVFARYTRGMKAQPFFKPGTEEALPLVQAIFKKVSDEIVVQLGD